jgi:hypothetical protein
MIGLKRYFIIIFSVYSLVPANGAAGGDRGLGVAKEISHEAALPNINPTGRPLPLAASWNTGTRLDGFDPDYQIAMIEQGHHLLPWFQLDAPQGHMDVNNAIGYYRKALRRCAELGLPVSFISSQWERLLTDRQHYRGLPASLNPNVVNAEGSIAPMASPFGPVEPWTEVGRLWTQSEAMQQIQYWYPNPPRVLFISNNEHPKLAWQDANTDQRYLAQYGGNTTGETKRKVIGQAWIKRYRALQQGMRDGLTRPAWKSNAIFVGYDAFGPAHFGRWAGWMNGSLSIPGRIDPSPLAWDGASVSYYANDWNPSTDYTVWSPQIEAMNWVFMLEDAYALNPNFWLEMSVWDGSQPNQPSDKRAYYAKQGQQYGPWRYAGMVKFGMWLLRPRSIREYRGHAETRAGTEAYFQSIVRAVDDVYASPLLTRFWQHGNLVANTHFPHPYMENIPAEYASRHRWYLLDTDEDINRPWALAAEIPLYAIALVTGAPPAREWLIYGFSPLRERLGVTVTLPDYGRVRINASPSGKYSYLNEKTNKVRPLE